MRLGVRGELSDLCFCFVIIKLANTISCYVWLCKNDIWRCFFFFNSLLMTGSADFLAFDVAQNNCLNSYRQFLSYPIYYTFNINYSAVMIKVKLCANFNSQKTPHRVLTLVFRTTVTIMRYRVTCASQNLSYALPCYFVLYTVSCCIRVCYKETCLHHIFHKSYRSQTIIHE